MHRTVIIFMVLEVPGWGALGSRATRNAWTVFIFMVLEVGWRVAAAGLRIIRNALDYYHFHGFGSSREGCGWLHNHKKCIGLSSSSWFWKWAGGGRLASEIRRNA